MLKKPKILARRISEITLRHHLIVAATLMIAPVAANASAQTTQPSSTQAPANSDWSARIDSALRESGSVDAIAAELGTSDTENPGLLRARYRVAVEQGRLDQALSIAGQLSSIDPSDVKNLTNQSQLEQLQGTSDDVAKILSAGIAAAKDPLLAAPLRLRLAILLFDDGQTAGALGQLDECVKFDSSASTQAAIVAFLFNQFDAASRYLSDASQKDSALGLLEGNAALEADNTGLADRTFNECLHGDDVLQDKRYIQERLISTARQNGSLGKLADQWLVDDKLPAERVVPLLTVLRELDRVPELLAWWHRAAENPAYKDTALSQRVVQEVLGAAQSAKLTTQAETIAGQLLALQPDSRQWLAINLQILLPDKKDEEADALIRAQIKQFADAPVELHEVGLMAESFGRNAVAVEAARRLQELGGGNAIAGQLLEASVLFDTGKPKEGTALLNHAANAATLNPEAAADVADAFEDAGQRSEATNVLLKRFQSKPDLEIAERLASLLMLQDRSTEALPLLDYLRRLAPSAGLRTQSRQHIVEIAVAGKTLDDLIAKTRAIVDSPAATPDDVTLLVDAYVAAKNGKAADDLLQNTKLISAQDRLQQRVLLDQRLGDLDAADATLHEMLKAEPAHADQILQQIWSLAMKRGKPDDAATAITQLQARLGDGSGALEMLASLNDGLGHPLQAARCYRRAIAMSEEGSEDWLLWATALTKAGQKDLAEHRLEALIGEASKEDTFAVAVDGLLNLRAQKPALRAARREAIFRVAQSPRDMTYYHLVGDLSDELGDNAMGLAVVKVSIAMNREERPELLRQLLETAGQKGMVETAIDAGRSLLSLGSDFPPQLFQELGEQLLIAGREQDAARAFGRAEEVSLDDVAGSVTRAAGLFTDYGYYDHAIAELNRVEGQRTTDPAYHETLGDLDEHMGQPDAAFAQYMIAIRQIAHGILEASDQPPAQKKTAPAAGGGSVGMHGSGPVDKSGLSRLVLYASATARRSEQQTQLLQVMAQYLQDLMQHTGASTQVPDSVAIALTALRHASFCLHQPDFAEQADRQTIKHWPDSAMIKQDALAERVKQGLYANANQFAIDMEMKVPIAVMLANQPVKGSFPSTKPATPNLTDEVAALPGMIAMNQLDLANDTLISIVSQADKLTPDQFTTSLTAAAAMDNSDAVDSLAMQWVKNASAPQRQRNNTLPRLTSKSPTPMQPVQTSPGVLNRVTRTIRPSGSSMRQTPLQKAVATSWRLLSAGSREKLLHQLVAASLAPDGRRSDSPLVTLQIAASFGLELPDSGKIIDKVISRDSFDTAMASQLFGLLPDDQRSAYISNAIAKLPPDQGLRFLIEIVAQTADPFGEATAKAVITAADHLAKGQDYEWINWFANLSQKAVLPAIAQAVIRNGANLPLPQNTASLAAGALAFSNAGNQALADKTALEAIVNLDKLESSSSDAVDINSLSQFLKVSFFGEWFNQACLQIAVKAMSFKAREGLIASLADDRIETSTAILRTAPAIWPLLKRSVLLDANGEREQSLKQLRTAFSLDDMNQDLSIVYLDRLQNDDRLAEVVDAFSKPAGLSSDATFASDFRKAVGQTLFLLYRPNEVHRFSKDTVGNPITIPANLFNLAASNDPVKLAEVFRSEVISSLRSGAGLSTASTVPPSLEGLEGAKQRWQKPDEISAIATDIANWPGCIEDMQAELCPYPAPGAFSSGGINSIQKLLAEAIKHRKNDEPLVQSLMQLFESYVKSGTMTEKDRFTLGALAVMPGISAPPDLRDDLWRSAMADTSGGSLSSLANILRSQNDTRAADIEKWTAAQAKVNGTRNDPSQFEDPSNRTLTWSTSSADPTPTESIDDAGLAKALGLLLDQGELNKVESQISQLRASGRITPDNIHCGLLWARVAGEKGDMPAFSSRLRQILLTWSAQETAPLFTDRIFRPVINIAECLPSVCSDAANRTSLCKSVENSILEQSNAHASECDLTRMLVTLGDWSFHQGDPQFAAQILEVGATLADQQGDGEHQLWIADLALELGQSRRSIEIEQRLLTSRCLPPSRMTTVIEKLKRAPDSRTAELLLKDAKSYCADPSLQTIEIGVH